MERTLKARTLDQGWRLWLVALALVSSALLSQLSALAWVDDQLHDWLTRTLPQRPSSTQVTLVDIDERSLAELGPWPWPRPVIARLMQSLRDRWAKLQVWEMFFVRTRPGRFQACRSAGQRPRCRARPGDYLGP